jgi:ribonuclease P protein component
VGVTRRFPRAARVRTRAEYDRIFQHGRRVALPVLALHWRPAFQPPVADAIDRPSTPSEPAANATPSKLDALAVPNAVEPTPASANAPEHRSGSQARGAPAARDRTQRADTASVAPPSPDAGARLGLAVSRKVDRRAVVRNRIKRGLRETFRAQRATLAPGEYVVVARPGAAALDADALQRTLLTLLHRAGALPPAPPAGTMPAAACTDRVQPPSR